MTTHAPRLFTALFFLACVAPPASTAEKPPWWGDDVAEALGRAAQNRAQLEKVLTGVPEDQRQGVAFLVANMPDRDLRSLRADFLLENVALAYQARKQVP